MLTVEANELLTQTGPGTPLGDVFRRFWLPALLTEELPAPDCPPVRVRLLGEDLIAFRDSSGRVGVFDAYCPHRNAPLFFGRNEEDGLRCVYHGWKFDASGQCVDMPNCEEGDDFKQRVQVQAYPAFEGGNMVWIYMGPKDTQPPRPGFEWLEYPGNHVYVTKYYLDCNYLQTLENEFADGHATFLHSSILSANGAFKAPEGAKLYGHYEIFETDYGAVSGRRREDGKYTLGGHWMMPVYSSAGAVSAPGTQPINMKVPMDDTHCVFFRLKWSHEPIKEDVIKGYLNDNYEFPTRIPGTYYSAASKDNNYFIDRNQQKHFSYTGMWPYPVQDFAVAEDQRGPLANRNREVLVSSDRYIIYVRRRLMRLLKDLQQGIEPREPWEAAAFEGIRNFKEIDAEEPGYRLVGKPELLAST